MIKITSYPSCCCVKLLVLNRSTNIWCNACTNCDLILSTNLWCESKLDSQINLDIRQP